MSDTIRDGRRPRRMWMRLVAILAVVGLIAAACSSDADDDGGGTAASPGDGSYEGLEVGMALGGPPDDQGFFQAFADGLELAEERLGVDGSVQGNLDTEQKRVDAVRNLASDNAVVIAAGAEMSNAMLEVGPEFPDVKFLSISGEMDSSVPNVTAFIVRQGTPNAVGAEVMSNILTPEKFGVVGGGDIPPTTQTIEATQVVAEKQDPPAEVVDTIVQSFEDTAGAKEAAAAMINEGVTAIVAFVNTGIDGVIAAINDAGQEGEVLTIDQIFPRCDQSESIVGTSILDVGEQIVTMIEQSQEGDLPSEPVLFGLEDPKIQAFVLCPEYDTPENQQIVEETTEAINNGTFGLPDDV